MLFQARSFFIVLQNWQPHHGKNSFRRRSGSPPHNWKIMLPQNSMQWLKVEVWSDRKRKKVRFVEFCCRRCCYCRLMRSFIQFSSFSPSSHKFSAGKHDLIITDGSKRLWEFVELLRLSYCRWCLSVADPVVFDATIMQALLQPTGFSFVSHGMACRWSTPWSMRSLSNNKTRD